MNDTSDLKVSAISTTIIKKIKSLLEDSDFVERHKKEAKHFIRNRDLPFKMTIIFLLSIIKKTVQSELDYFFGRIKNSITDIHKVSDSAFTQARAKLKHSAFIELDKMQCGEFFKNIKYRTWKNLRLTAIDGSTIRLHYTKELAKIFGIQTEKKSGSPVIKARISESFDPLNQITLDAQIQPYSCCELQMLIAHICELAKGVLAILDRNYPAFWVYKLLLNNSNDFCIRVKTTGTKIIEKFVQSGKKETIIELECPDSSKKRCNELGLDQKSIKCRLVRVELEKGKIEILITSLLDNKLYPYKDFKELYHLRWPVEEKYKNLKCRLQIENFSGKTLEAIYQDFFAKIFTSNLVAIMAFKSNNELEKKKAHCQYNYRINWSNAYTKMKNFGFLLFTETEFEEILLCLESLLLVKPVANRPSRSYERNHGRNKRIFSLCYK